MTEQVQKTGTARYHELKAQAKDLGIDTTGMNMEALQEAIEAKKSVETTTVDTDDTKGPTGITPSEAKSIEAKMRFEEETRDKIRAERRIATDRAEIIAESESLNIPIDLPDTPTLLQLARARVELGMKKKEFKPSPETLGIEAGKRGYYLFNNLEQKDANHTVNLGGKYIIHLIAKQVHVLSDFHIKRWNKIAVTPEYKRVPTGNASEGRLAESCQRVGSERRFSFEFMGEAPQDAEFGLVTDEKILKELTE